MKPIQCSTLFCGLLGMLLFQQSFVCAQEVAYSPRSRQAERQDQKGRSLESVLAELERKFEIHFSFDSEMIGRKSVGDDVKFSDNLEESLNRLLAPYRLRFEKVSEKYYAIFPEKDRRSGRDPRRKAEKAAAEAGRAGALLPPVPGSLQPAAPALAAVSGRVMDQNDEPLVGVNVLQKGTTVGTVTDARGRYNLDVSGPDAVLTFSFIGYVTGEVAVGNRTQVDVQLVADVKALSEVVVVGYGTQQRKDVTGAISSVSEKEIRAVPVTGVDQALQGRAPGVQVLQNSGAPGGSVSVRVRGVGTVGNNEPLYVVDGVPVFNTNDGSNSNTLNTINPNDIASMEVLKDASATAIYGSRGANGVVIITTRRGAAGRTAVNFDSYYGVQQATRMVEMLDARQFAELHNEILGNGKLDLNPAFSDPASLGRGTDWLGELFRTAPIRNHNLSVIGGSDKTQFAVSGGYFKQDGIIIGTDFDRYSLRFNLDTRVSDRLRFGNSIGLSRTTQQVVTTDEDTQSGLVYLAMAQQPTLPVYENGTFAGPLGPVAFVGDKSNPIGIANTVDNSIHKNRLLGNVYGEYEIIPGLRYRLNLGLDALFRKSSNWNPDYTWGGIVHPLSELSQTSTEEFIWLAENTLTYSRQLGKHALTVLAGTTAQASHKEFMRAATKDFASNATRVLGAGNPKNASVHGEAEEWSLLSYIGRVNYGFADKYLFTGTVRVDGSSRFGPGNRFGVFPSGSVAWRLSEEKFFQPLTGTVNDVKVRASYGITGNQEIGLYPFAALLSLDQRYTFGSPNAYYTGVGPSNLPNPDVRWEQVAQADLGVDVALLQNRIRLTADYYVKNTSGMLLALPVPATTGYTGPPTVNVGKVRNQGIELGINSENLTGALKWGTSLNFAGNRNTVISLGDSLPINGAGISLQQTLTRTQVGHPIGSFFGYVTDGIFQTQEEVNDHARQNPGDNPSTSTAPGDIRFKDLNGDGVINASDRTFIGNPMPRFIFGLTNSLEFKGFDLSVFVQGIVGNKVYNVNRTYNEQMSGAFNQTVETLDRWRSAEAPGNGSVPRAVWNDPNYNARPSDRFVEDGSYVRIKNLTLGYSLPNGLLSALRIAQVRLYATAQNLYTFTKFKGFDPETGSFQQSSLYTGVNNGTYPVARTLIMGLNVGF